MTSCSNCRGRWIIGDNFGRSLRLFIAPLLLTILTAFRSFRHHIRHIPLSANDLLQFRADLENRIYNGYRRMRLCELALRIFDGRPLKSGYPISLSA